MKKPPVRRFFHGHFGPQRLIYLGQKLLK